MDPRKSKASLSPKHFFDQPPLIETVLGAQFKPLAGLTNGHLGAFWSKLGKDWPNCKDMPPLPPAYERFEIETSWAGLGGMALQLTDNPASRMQIRNSAQDRMIQIQNGRFHYNWIKVNDVYPHFTSVFAEFQTQWKSFCNFLEGMGLGKPVVDQWEVTYVNHIPKGSVWSEPSDWGKLFRGLGLVQVASPGIPETLGLAATFQIPKRVGRLHWKQQHALLNDPKPGMPKEVLRLELTARGPISEAVGLEAGLNIGHEAIIDTFVAHTSDEAHKFWGLHGNR